MRSRQLTGFTLFFHPGKGWQMSTRRHEETGWSITHIPQAQAEAVLSMLETGGHPDGPWSVKPIGLEGELNVLGEAIRALTEVINGVAR